MRRIMGGRGPHRFIGLAALALVFGAIAGAGAFSAPDATAQATGTVAVQKVLQLPGGGMAPQQDLSGYVFVLSGGGQQITMPATNAQGQTAINVAPGNYSITEQPRAGATLQGFFIGMNAVGSFAVAAGQTVTLTAVNQVAGTGSISIVKQILDANNQVVTGAPRSGFMFTVTGPNNFSQTVTTDANGQAQLINLAAGNYTVTETVPAGFTIVSASVDGALSTNTPTFTVSAAQTRTVLFNNRQSTSGTITITKQIIDANNQPVPGASRAGFQFTVTCGTTTLSGTTDASGTVTISNVPAGSCQLTETLLSGFTFVSGQVGTTTPVTTNPGTYTVTAGQSLAINVVNRQSAQTETIQLTAGCNNIALTWPAGTPISTVAAAVSPGGALESIWRQTVINNQQAFQAWSPILGAPNDYLMTSIRPEAAWICMRQPGTITRPVVS